MMNRWILKKVLPLLLLFLLLFALPNSSIIAGASEETDRDSVYYYLKTHHVNGEQLQKSSIDEMISSLDDPYTEYFTQEGYEAFINQIDGTLVGVGIYLEEKDGYIVVLSPIKNSPAANAGIEPGDKIIAVNGASVVGKPMNEITSQVRGKEGTKVLMTFLRGEEELTFELTRAKIEIPLVDYELLEDEGIGYIHLTSFGDNTYPELLQALLDIDRAEIDNIILDLRGNPGGKISSVLEIARLFIGDGPIMWVKSGVSAEESYSSNSDNWWKTPIVLLVDKGSASASEVLAGALKDYHLATIIGDQSFGKGVMQSLVPLPSGSVLKLTTNEFFSPRKNKINNIGIQPDIWVEASNDPLTFAKEWLQQADLLRNGKAGAITLEANRVNELDQWVLHKDGWYVALYRLHTTFGGDLVWDDQTRAATYTINGVKQSFTMGKDQMLVKDGHIYAPIGSINGLPNLSITTDQAGNVTIKR